MTPNNTPTGHPSDAATAAPPATGTSSGVQRSAIDKLPVIDVSPLLVPGDRGARERVGRQIRQACIDIGFFYISGHGFSEAEMHATLMQARRFFSLPLETKMQSTVTATSEKMGFLQVGGLNPAANTAKRPDLKERLFLPREPEAGDVPFAPAPWPTESVLPGFGVFMKNQIARKVLLARSLARGFALSLDLDEAWFDDYYLRPGVVNALNYYPPAEPSAQGEPQWGFSPHTDYGSFTILLQDDHGGLQAQNSDGQWIDVPHIPGTFVVNVGDLLERWTNNFYVSTLHRAINLKPAARISNSFFVYPDPASEIRCLDTCQSAENPSLFEPVNSGAYIESLFSQVFRTGSAARSERTASRVGQNGY